MKCTAIVMVMATVLLSFAQRTQAQQFSQVLVFGDSNVDSGWFRQVSGGPGDGTSFNADWPTALANGAGVPTTSPALMDVEVLANYFNLTATPANTSGGTNYATSGAKNDTTNFAANGGFTNAIPTGTQIRSYLSAHGNTADPQAIYVIWSGDNDVSYANGDTGTTPPSNPQDYLLEAAEDLGGDIQVLQQAGARHIVVAGLAYDFPRGSSTDATNHRALKLFYTNALFQNLTQIGINYTPVNTDQLRLAIFNNPSQYGFTNVGTNPGQMACSEPSGVTTAWALLCSSSAGAPSTWAGSTNQTDLFADDQHLGSSGQQLMGQLLYQRITQTITHNVNGDASSDIVWRESAGGVAVWLMDGSSILQSGGLGTVTTNWQIVAQRDFNADGKADLLWRDANTGTTAIWFMNGLQASPATVATVGTTWSVVGTGDFNGDGNGDILWRDSSSNAVALWLMTGSVITQSGNIGVVPSNWVIAGTGDFNGDGYTDILWRDNNTGTVAIWLMNGLQVIQTGSLGMVPGNWGIIATGDFDGNGTWDILWRDSNTNTIAVWLLNGFQVTQTGTLGSVPSNWVVAETGNFNDIGRSDLLWRDTNAGTVAIWYMNGVQVSSTATVGAVGTDWTIQGSDAD